jgi:hypothetical protein
LTADFFFNWKKREANWDLEWSLISVPSDLAEIALYNPEISFSLVKGTLCLRN